MKRVIIAAALVLSAPAFAAPVTGSVEFKGKATPGFLTIPGKGGKLTGDVTVTGGVATGTLTVNLADFSTEIDMRDDHMKNKYLEVGTYPTATLVLKPWTVTAAESDFEGDLTLHGVTKPVKGKAKVDGKKLAATMKVKASEYGIPAPDYGVGKAKVTMGEEIDVTVTATAP